MTLETPLAELAWITPQRVRQLERFELRTVADLLTHFPRRYEDRTQFDHFPSGESDAPVCVCGLVKKTSPRRMRGWQKMFDVVLEEDAPHALSQPLVCRWFNSHWVEKVIATGQRLVVFGRAKCSGSSVVITHPEFEVAEEDAEASIHLGRIAPIHGATEGLSPRVLRRLIWDTLAQLEPDAVPARIPPDLDSTPRADALRQIHFPDSSEALAKARRHLVVEEFFAMQLSVAARRAATAAQPGAAHCGSGALMRRLHASLPFALTTAQERAIREIGTDLATDRPMNRLLHGDVGSGKTLVALSAMLLAVEAGHQAALMAPTQILAEQHYLNFKRLLEPLGIGVALRTGVRKEESGPLELWAGAESARVEVPGSARVLRAGEGVSGMRDVSSSGGTGVPPVPAGILPGGTARAPDPSQHPNTATEQTYPQSAEGPRYTRRNLPHFEKPWAIYAVDWRTTAGRTLPPAARDVVLDSILHWDGKRFELFAACVMPDHVHLLLRPAIKEMDQDELPVFFTLSELLHSIKSFSAKQVNAVLGLKGTLWQEERFDRYMRSGKDLEEKFHYILGNPWAAKVVAWGEPYQWVWHPGCEPRDSAGQDVRRDGRDARSTHEPLAAPLPNAAATAPDERAHRSSIAAPSSAPLIPNPAIFIGTHALLYEGTGLTHLGLAVIDEQHKFGVLQRARLRARGVAPDVLVMTATPIPRTLTMTVYGDLDISTLDELPANRGKIITAARDPSKLPEAVQFIRQHLEAGRQAYVVYPLIDESEKLEAKAAAAEFEKWKTLLAPMKCELLHGRIPTEEKEAIMARFRSGAAKVLIATTVIEVGIDVPNATIMLIENAERFGLAQIHQLRGRIGRGEHKSYCILFSSKAGDAEAQEKLRILEQTRDGFEIAEADLRLRGPGDILGTAQSGLPPLKLGDVFRDADLMQLARQRATALFAEDPLLELPEHAAYRSALESARKLTLAEVS